MSALTLTYSGSLSIPASVFQSAHIREGDQIDVRVEGESIVLERHAPVATRASVVPGKHGRRILRAPDGSAPMTVESVKQLMEDLDLP